MPKPEPSQEQRPDIKQAFLRYLPERIEAIDGDWRALVTAWIPTKLAQLLQRVQDIAGLADKFGLIRVRDTLLPFAQCLQALLEVHDTPSHHQIAQANELVNRLNAVCRGDADTLIDAFPEAKDQRPSIFYVYGGEDLAPGLSSAMDGLRYSLLRVTKMNVLIDKIAKQPPAVLVVESAILPQIAKFIADNIAQKKTTPPLVVLSSTSVLDVRLMALRAGAVAFFVAPIDPQTVAIRIHRLLAPTPEAPYRILIMDDDPPQAEFASAILRKSGMDIRPVTDPAQIVAVLDEFRPDLVLMDLYMPGVDGLELTRIIREQTAFADIPIVFMSGEQDLDKQLDALNAGGDDFITKPVRLRRLVTIVKSRILRARAAKNQDVELTDRDPITGLLNRRSLFEHLDRVLASGHQELIRSLICLEIDNLAQIRENIGIRQADTLLVATGARILAQLAPSDLCARIDDNRFVVLAARNQEQELTSLGEALVQSVIQQRLPIDGLKFQPTLSAGLCLFTPAPFDAPTLEKLAVIACTKARKAGGNCLTVYAEEPPEESHLTKLSEVVTASNLQENLAAVRQALQDNHIQIQFRVYVDTHNNRTELYEMHWRLAMPDGGHMSATNVLTFAKQSPGLSKNIDRWLILHAMNILRGHRQNGKQALLLINQTAETLTHPDCATWLREELRKRLLVGSGLILGFNLTDLMADVKNARTLMSELSVMGIEMCLVKFGRNDASHKVLRYLKPAYVKVADKLIMADTDTVSILLQQVHESQSQLILPWVRDPSTISQYWLSGASFIQNNAIVTASV